MSEMQISLHAQTRLQQHGIPPIAIEFLREFGSAYRCGGAETLMFDKKARQLLRKHLGGHRSLKLIEPWLNVYAIIGDNGHIVTVARSTKHFRR
jgi:hypothetical protein